MGLKLRRRAKTVAARPRDAAAGPARWGGLTRGALVVVDTAPNIYLLEDHPEFLDRFVGLFKAEAAGDLQIAISTMTLAEMLTGPLRAGQDALAQRYEKALARFAVVPMSTAVAVLAARMRAKYGLKLPDALQLAAALDVGAAALVSHDRNFSRVEGLTVLRGEAPSS